MDYTIFPYEGVGPLRFGMTPEQVHEILGAPEDTLPAGSRGDLPADTYDDLGVYVYYKNPGQCEAIELMLRVAEPTLNGDGFKGMPMVDIRDRLRTIGSDIQYNSAGFISFKYGFSLYSSGYNPQLLCKVDALMVFEPGYYDKIADIINKYPREEATV